MTIERGKSASAALKSLPRWMLSAAAISCPSTSPLIFLHSTRIMALQYQSRPEPMNATPHHSKVKVSVTLSDSFYIAGDAVTGKMELESRADKGLGLGIIMVELVAIEGRYFLFLFPNGAPLWTR